VTLHERVAAACKRLRDAGIPTDEAELDARLLAEHVLGWSTERFFTDADQPAPDGFIDQYERLIARRAAREPFAYIVGHQEFWGLAFEVTPAVLIPRPETELLVEIVLELVRPDAASVRLCDAGTGSGCVAVALAHERPQAEIVAIDVSAEALGVARRNATRYDAAARIQFLQSDLFGGVAGAFDVVVSNPPYVPERDRSTMQPEVRDFEPGVALFAGRDGLDAVRRLVREAPARLAPNGWLVFEFGFGQADAVGELISSTAGLKMVDLRRDLQTIPRAAVAQRV
jgi:release factor glutamine methyltransferase